MQRAQGCAHLFVSVVDIESLTDTGSSSSEMLPEHILLRPVVTAKSCFRDLKQKICYY